MQPNRSVCANPSSWAVTGAEEPAPAGERPTMHHSTAEPSEVPTTARQTGATGLPAPRGPVTERLFASWQHRPYDLEGDATPDAVAHTHDEDLQLALYCCYELHYQGFDGVEAAWEWEPSLLGLRAQLEARFERQLTGLVGRHQVPVEEVVPSLRVLAADDGGRSLSRWVERHGTRWHLRELAKHRSAYQLKEADPHTWVIPRLGGAAKAVLVGIQADEYGQGVAGEMHASLFAETMQHLGLDPAPNRYLDELPAATLATTNLISLLGLHRRWRGALVGHLALFEMTSIAPMARYGRALQRLGAPPVARRFYDVHVEVDHLHQRLATDDLVPGLLRAEPELAADVIFGARALSAVEAAFTDRVLGAWETGRSSLRPSWLPVARREVVDPH